MHHRLILTITAVALALASGARADEEFRGRLVDAGNEVPGLLTATFTLHVDEYTTDEEAAELARLLDEKGSDALLEEVRSRDQGWIQIDANLGYPVGVVRQTRSADGKRIVRAITDRPLQMYEVMQGLRSADYPFGVIEIELDGDENGTGQLIAAADIRMALNGDVVIESYTTRPFRLVDVRVEEEPADSETAASTGSGR